MIRTTLAILPLLLLSTGAWAQETRGPAPGDDTWPWKPDRVHFTLKLTGGPTYRSLLETAVGTADLALAVGADGRRLSVFFTASGSLGETAFGLGVRQLAAGCQIEGPFDRVRLGFNPRIGYFAVDRVTRDDPFELISFSLIGSISVDLVNTGMFAFALGLAPSIEGLMNPEIVDGDGEGAPLFGVGFRVEVRWRAPREGDRARAARFER